MANNLYLKIAMTVIAAELLVLIFKTNSQTVVYPSAQATEQGAVQAKYGMPNAYDAAGEPITNVNIVSVGGRSLEAAYDGATGLPVVVHNTTVRDEYGTAKLRPLSTVTAVPKK